MAIKTNDVDPLVGGIVSPDDQVGQQRSAGANWIGPVGATTNNN